VTPFRIDVPDAQLQDLHDRLRRTRWPEAETVDDWSQGVPLGYLRDLCQYWVDKYDWRASEARLNRFPHYRTEIDGLGIHFIHARSPHPNALPLVITHGWPGSIVEFHKVIDRLTDPVDPADAFHVVCPSLPGYGFSDKPSRPGWSGVRIADAWSELMARLGYPRYGAQGGDWGSLVTTHLGYRDPQHLAGIHLNMVTVGPDKSTMDDLTEAERAALDDMADHDKWGTGYSKEQSTRPQTVGYGLVDSPVALCGWILEKFWAWTDCDGDPANALTRDEMLDNITVYWVTASGASSARLYWESFGRRLGDAITVPTGVSVFPKEIFRPSRRWAKRRYANIQHWNELDRGGHFAAFEQPELFVNELQTFFRLVR
jgi:pimeloyl-ACP methyl ester carboxylesterase